MSGFDSAYWMNEVLVRSQTVATLQKKAADGEVPRYEVRNAKGRLAWAIKKYTNPHNIERGIAA